MRTKSFCAPLLCALLAVSAGCGNRVSSAQRANVQKAVDNRSPAQIVTLSPPLEAVSPVTLNVAGGGERFQTSVAGGSITARNLWVYRPFAARTQPVRCVVMAPAGSHLFDGMNLGEGDANEHVGYLSSGIAVIACEVDGAIPDGQESHAAIAAAAKKFVAARAGIRNMQAAIDVAERLPWIDKKHIYVAGHSSAATLALQTAAYDKRVAGCIALAPEVNVPRFVGMAGQIEAAGATGLVQTLDALSPHNNIARLTKPMFLFRADDDTVIRPADVDAFAQAVQKTNKSVTLKTASSGGHYDSMVKQGIPTASAWLLKQP